MAKDMIIEKSITINKSKSEVFAYIKFAKNMDEYSVWNMADPSKKTEYSGVDGTIGFTYKWDSKDKNVGAGQQQIVNLIDGELIEYVLNFERPMKNTAQSKFILKSLNDGETHVSWDFRGPTKFPMSLFKGIFQKMLGKDIAQSLENLKAKLES